MSNGLTAGIERNGYRMQWCRRRKRYIYEHRLVMEEAIGHDLTSQELVHHINHDPLDNRLENLEVMSRAEHQRLHHAGVPKPMLRGHKVPPRTCQWCGKEGWWAKRLKCCSHSCGQSLRYAKARSECSA